MVLGCFQLCLRTESLQIHTSMHSGRRSTLRAVLQEFFETTKRPGLAETAPVTPRQYTNLTRKVSHPVYGHSALQTLVSMEVTSHGKSSPGQVN
jgi:hypothetical protein